MSVTAVNCSNSCYLWRITTEMHTFSLKSQLCFFRRWGDAAIFIYSCISPAALFCQIFFILHWRSLPLYPHMLQPHIASSRSICSLFLCLSIRVPWFPWDWILSQIMPEGGLSCMDPLGCTTLCKGSEVWEMWCIWPRGCRSPVFLDDLTGACGPVAHYSHICASISTAARVRRPAEWQLYYCKTIATPCIYLEM